MRIVYFGNADFGVPALDRLASSPHRIAAVVTNPDKPQGRGKVMTPTPIKSKALQLQLPVIEADNLSDEGFYQNLVILKADLFLVIAYRILPERIFTLPPQGTVNLHASLLPRYRGAAPIRWVLINGEKRTGVSTFFIEKSVDTGGIILQKETEIGEGENYGALYKRLAELGAEAVLETVSRIENSAVKPAPQDHIQATPAPKITKELCQIDWQQSAEKIVNLIRGLSPRPGAYTSWRDKILKLLEGKVASAEDLASSPGEIVSADFKNGLKIQTGEGVLQVLSLQLEGKSVLTADEFLRGYKIKVKEKFGLQESAAN